MKGMSIIVKTVTRWVVVFIFLFGAYIVITGHLTPGGGFAGGVIIACGYILLTLAFGKEFASKRLGTIVAHDLDSSGSLLFLAIALFGFSSGGIFFVNFLEKRFPGKAFHILSAGTIPISNFAIGLKVASSLFVLFVILSVLRIVVTKEGQKTMVQEEEEE